jgi:hypothetical protein
MDLFPVVPTSNETSRNGSLCTSLCDNTDTVLFILIKMLLPCLGLIDYGGSSFPPTCL